MSESLEVITPEPDREEDVPITLDAAALAKYRKDERLAAALAMEEIGSKVLKINTRVLAKIGSEIEKLGVKCLGYGYLASGYDNAGQALAKCDEMISDMLAKSPPTPPEVIVEIMRLKKEFNAQIIAVGESHLKASREAVSGTQNNNLSIPFPVGQSMVVSVTPK